MSLITRKYSDFNLDFTAHPVTGDITKKLNENAIAQSIRNLLLTSHYERPFKPQLGSNVKKFLFEPIDNITTSLIQDSIFETLRNYEPRITIQEVVATPNYDDQRYDVSITFFVKNSVEPLTINFFLERVR
jgi:phage baseplate assembly protein W